MPAFSQSAGLCASAHRRRLQRPLAIVVSCPVPRLNPSAAGGASSRQILLASTSPRTSQSRGLSVACEAKRREGQFRPPRFGEQPWQYALSIAEDALVVRRAAGRLRCLPSEGNKTATPPRFQRVLPRAPRPLSLYLSRAPHQRFPQAQAVVRFIREQPLLSVGIGVALASAISITIASVVLPTIFFAVRAPRRAAPRAAAAPPPQPTSESLEAFATYRPYTPPGRWAPSRFSRSSPLCSAPSPSLSASPPLRSLAGSAVRRPERRRQSATRGPL